MHHPSGCSQPAILQLLCTHCIVSHILPGARGADSTTLREPNGRPPRPAGAGGPESPRPLLPEPSASFREARRRFFAPFASTGGPCGAAPGAGGVPTRRSSAPAAAAAKTCKEGAILLNWRVLINLLPSRTRVCTHLPTFPIPLPTDWDDYGRTEDLFNPLNEAADVRHRQTRDQPPSPCAGTCLTRGKTSGMNSTAMA